MTAERTFRLVDWGADFLREIGLFLADRDPRSVSVVFPHRRPALYLKRFFASEPGLARPRLLPEMLSFEELVSKLRRGLAPDPLKPARKLDQAALLHDIAVRLRSQEGGLLAELPLERERFLPWGLRLASLLEELLRQGIEPGDLRHLEGEVIDWAAALLEHLDAFHREYLLGLEERGWTTPGLECRRVMARLDQALDQTLAASFPEKQSHEVVCAGFYALSGAEDAIFRALWERNQLHVFWHSDPALALGGPAHPCTVEHRAWLRAWNSRVELHGEQPSPEHAPQISFVEGFDLHSQLSALRAELRRDPDAADTAIVLPDEGALLPVLHHLPEHKEVNVSMGYPLERTALYQLVETVLRCRENRDAQGRYYWRDLVELVRHPYLKMLRAQGGPDQDRGPALRPVLFWLENAIRTGEPMQDPAQWLPPYGEPPLERLQGAEAEAVEALRRELLDICLGDFGRAETLAGLAQALQRLAALLLRAGSHLWKAYVTDAEYLARLLTSVIPQLLDTALSHAPLGSGTLFALFRQLCHAERVSFEAEPLTGLQVMGVLETRLLRFRRLFVLDAVEERLPGSRPVDPLLPDPLRHLLGLPDARERDNVSAYNFHRLIMGASQAVLLYQSGVQPGALEGKSVRSRYVEQLLWEKEKELGRLVEPGDGPPLTAVRFRSDPLRHGLAEIPRTPGLQTRLEARLAEQGLSPSQLERYLLCPKLFFYQYLTPLRALEEMDEDGDRAEFGTVVHETLRDFLLPHLETEQGEVDVSSLDSGRLTRLFEEKLDLSGFFPRMPLDARRSLLEAGSLRLKRFLENQGPTRILELERRAQGRIDLDGKTIRLHGRLDRADRRPEGVVILDYKTGGVKRPRRGFWDDNALWTRLEAPDPADRALLSDLQRSARGLQLPAYLRMYLDDRSESPYDAAWVHLAKDGREYGLFPEKWTPEERTEAVAGQCATLLRAVATHLAGADSFFPLEGRHCEFCDYRGPCGK
ncbi:MAG: PD-(D/E)XK nuclease family protein [Desulfovibrio sp.]